MCKLGKRGKESRTTGAKNFHDLFGVNEKENGCTVADVIKSLIYFSSSAKICGRTQHGHSHWFRRYLCSYSNTTDLTLIIDSSFDSFKICNLIFQNFLITKKYYLFEYNFAQYLTVGHSKELIDSCLHLVQKIKYIRNRLDSGHYKPNTDIFTLF